MFEENQNLNVNCLFNFVIYAKDDKRIEYLKKMISKVWEKFPCRTIIIQPTTNEEKEGIVQTLKDFNATKSRAGEQLTIKASKEQLKLVPFVLLPLLMPDLPIYLIWGESPAQEKIILPELQKFATRLVFDSDCDPNLQHFSESMLKKLGNLQCDFMDIDWASLSGWRDVLAQVFDNPLHFDILKDCLSVEIKYNVLESPSIRRKATQAIYLQAWLATQLAWQYESLQQDKDISKIHYQKNNNEIKVTLQPVERQNLPTGTVIEVGFLSVNNRSLSLTFDEKQFKIFVYLSTPERCELPFSLPLPNLQRGLAFIKEVFYHRADQHYLNMLKTLSKVSWIETEAKQL